jgi:hypothetical protein
MKIALRLLVCAWLLATSATALAEETWQDALAKMPLGIKVTQLNRTNCVPLMLGAFRSNSVVKGLIFMPGATDEIYFFRRMRAALTNANPSMLDAVNALANQTYIQAAFRPPFLLLHTTEDALDGMSSVDQGVTTAQFREKIVPGHFVFDDRDWDAILRALNGKLKIELRPVENSVESWHFYRHTLVANNLTEWEMLEALALAGKTTFAVHPHTVDFKPDNRHGIVPKLEKFPGDY